MRKLFVLFCTAILLSVVGCNDVSKCEFQIGEMVEFKIVPQIKGQIRETYMCGNNSRWIGFEAYSVRVAGVSMTTNSHLLADDEPVTIGPVSLVRGIRPYELQSVSVK